MRTIPFLLPLALVLLATSCCDEDRDCRRAIGPNITTELDLPPMDGISLELPAGVVLRQGSQQRVLVTGPENVIEDLERRVSNGVWDIKTDHCWKDFEEINFDITLPEYRSLAISGVGDMFSIDTLQAEDISLAISGKGKYELALHAQRVNAVVSGVGDVALRGEAEELYYELSGTGDLFAFDFPVNHAELTLSGIGDARVHARDFLKVRIAGVGDVYYHGQPDLDVLISGTGNMVEAP